MKQVQELLKASDLKPSIVGQPKPFLNRKERRASNARARQHFSKTGEPPIGGREGYVD